VESWLNSCSSFGEGGGREKAGFDGDGGNEGDGEEQDLDWWGEEEDVRDEEEEEEEEERRARVV
jgi:hypothetical protein